MKRKRLPLTILCVALVIVAGILTVIFVFVPRPPTITLIGFPEALAAGERFSRGKLLVKDGTPPFSFTCAEAKQLGIVLDQTSRSVMWERPSKGEHALTFAVTDGNHRTGQTTWRVKVEEAAASPSPDTPAAPSLSALGLPAKLPAGVPFAAGRIEVKDGAVPVNVSVEQGAELGVAVDTPTLAVSWPSPSEGEHTIVFRAADKLGQTGRMSWQVKVESPPSGTTEQTPTTAPPAVVVESLPATIEAGAAFTAALETSGDEPVVVTCDLGAINVSGNSIAWDEPTPGRHSVIFTVTDPQGRSAQATWSVHVEEKQEPQPSVPWEPIPKFADEIDVQVQGSKKLYGRGARDETRPPNGYLANRLRRGGVTFIYDFAEAERIAGAEIDALIEVGAALAEDASAKESLKPTGAAQRLLQARGAGGLTPPWELWWAVLRTADRIQRINRGSITWRIRPYASDPTAYVIVIRPEDIVKE